MVWFALHEQPRDRAANARDDRLVTQSKAQDATGVVATLRNSRYLQSIAVLIFVSVIVSTLIDYQFKAAAKEAYPSTDALAAFFGSYYVWLSVVTFLAQVGLTRRLLMGFRSNPQPASPLSAGCGICKLLGLAGPLYGDRNAAGRSLSAHERQSQRRGDSLCPHP